VPKKLFGLDNFFTGIENLAFAKPGSLIERLLLHHILIEKRSLRMIMHIGILQCNGIVPASI
jgi:hypothetical protein